MSPKVRIQKVSDGEVLFDATCSDKPVSGFYGDNGTNLTVRSVGVVEVESPLLRGAFELPSGRRVNGEGLKLGFSQKSSAVLLREEKGVISLLTVTAEPLTHGGIHRERM